MDQSLTKRVSWSIPAPPRQRAFTLQFKGLTRQKSVDFYTHRFRRHSSNEKDASIRRVQSFQHDRKTNRRTKVLFRARGKTYMKVTLSPDKSPEAINTDFDLSIKGAKTAFQSSKTNLEKSFDFYIDTPRDGPLPADLIIKENNKEIRRIPLEDIKKENDLSYKEIGVKVVPNVMKYPELRTYDTADFLCKKEKDFLQKREVYTRGAIKKLINAEIDSSEFEVPRIAVMGSGGGYRAMTAMSGIYNALHDTNILDTVLYTAALSGSSWYIAVLYSHPEWPNIDPRDIQQTIKKNVTEKKHSLPWIFTRTAYSYIKNMITCSEWDFTSDIFGPLLGESLLPYRQSCKWSKQSNKMSEGTIPLPLLAAIHTKAEGDAKLFHEWVEFSPYEVNLSKYGSAIKMEHFGSEFYKGVMQNKHEELPLYLIMGICGSAYALTYEELKNKDASCVTAQKKKNKIRKRQNALNVKNANKNGGNEELDGTRDELDGPRDKFDGPFDELDGPCDELDGPRDELDGPCDGFRVDGKTLGQEKGMKNTIQDYNKRDTFCISNGTSNTTKEPNEGDVSGCVPRIIDVLTIKHETSCKATQILTDGKSEDDKSYDENRYCQEPSIKDLDDIFAKLCEIRNNNKMMADAAEGVDKKENGVADIAEENDLKDNCVPGSAEGEDQLDGFLEYIPVDAKKCLMKNRLPMACGVKNFMRKVSFDDEPTENKDGFENFLKCQSDMETLLLIDAGLAFNSPYPLLFQPGRDVDIILSFDFTDRKLDSNSPFKTLLKAAEWAKKNNVKFPPINEEEYKDGPIQEMYVFEDNSDIECPIIMHFVLVNKDFWKYEKPGKERSEKEKANLESFRVYDDQKTYNCTNFNYTEESFDRLAQLSEFIVLNNVKRIKDCIQKRIVKKRRFPRKRHPTAP